MLKMIHRSRGWLSFGSNCSLSQESVKACLKQEIRSNFKTDNEIKIAAVSDWGMSTRYWQKPWDYFPLQSMLQGRSQNSGGNITCGEFVLPGVHQISSWIFLCWDRVENRCNIQLSCSHNSGSWKDAEALIPERWLDEKEHKNEKRVVIHSSVLAYIGRKLDKVTLLVVHLLTKSSKVLRLQICDSS